ncbi:hypothetical protein J6590_040569 [Homalodisca vitripennis]|nr:hypothetical protein J6590_040569 [Homalodisca vitripennis]
MKLLDVNIAFVNFVNILTSSYNELCPVIEVKPKKGTGQSKKKTGTHFNNWFTLVLRTSRDILLMLYDRWKCTESVNDKNRYTNFKKLYKRDIANAKKTVNDDLILNAKNKCQMAWNVIRRESGSVKCKPEIHITPECLNNYFVNVSTLVNNLQGSVDLDAGSMYRSHSDFLLNFDKHIPETGFSWQHVDSDVILSVVSNLSNSKSEDVFGLSNYVIKALGNTLLIYFSLRDIPAEDNTSECVKLLGFTLDNQLSWEPHILNLCKRLSRVVFLLRKLKQSLPDTDKWKGWELQEARTCSRADLTEAGNSKRPGASRRRKSLESRIRQRPKVARDRELRFRHCKRLGPGRSRALPETRSSE